MEMERLRVKSSVEMNKMKFSNPLKDLRNINLNLNDFFCFLCSKPFYEIFTVSVLVPKIYSISIGTVLALALLR